MKKLAAAAIIASVAALAAPFAGAQSQPAAISAAAPTGSSPLVPVKLSANPDSAARSLEFNGSTRDLSPISSTLGAPEPGVAWLLALGFLGLVVMRRTRSSSHL
jgi:hypothetical protein